jgi:hypothetical protein
MKSIMANEAVDIGIHLLVAGETPTHRHIAVLAYLHHFLHGSVTIFAYHSRVDMPIMIEAYKIGEVIDLYPLDRASLLPELGQLFHFRLVSSDEFVTTHAYFYGRYSSHRCFIRIHVTVQAGNLVITCMDLVAKRDRLIWKWFSILTGA